MSLPDGNGIPGESFCLLIFAFCLLPSSSAQSPPFVESAAETGLRFHHFTGATGAYYLPEIMGAGAALFDYDNDGDLDVYLIQGTSLDETKKPVFPPAKDFKPGNRLFRNELVPSGKLRFTDVTEKAGVGLLAYGMGAATGDYDNDGNIDLYLTNFGPNVLYRNNGNGTFTDVTRKAGAGLEDPRWSTSAAFLDYDRDGALDLFVLNYVDFTIKGNKPCEAPSGERDYCAPAMYRPLPARLFHNNKNGSFTDVTQSAGIGSSFGAGLGVACVDVNLDGLIDIYVANDGSANMLWINNGDGTFEESGLMAGAAYSADGAPRAGMGVAADDIDRDGDDDILVTNLTRQGSTLYRNQSMQGGKGQFEDATIEFSLAQPSFPFTGFGAVWFDSDQDGWLDLFTANGAVTFLPALRGQPYPFHQRNQLFHNEGGKSFREITNCAALQLSEVSRGVARGDIDNDGDLDLLVTNNNGPVRLLLNQTNRPGSKNHWLQVQAIGTEDNRLGLGARVALLREDGSILWRRAHTDGSYLSAGDPRVHFGLGTNPRVQAIGIVWPNGSREVWTTIKTNSLNRLQQKTGKPWKS